MNSILTVVGALTGAVLLLVGCTPGEQPGDRADPRPSAPTLAQPSVEPTLDPTSGLWLRDGWPVPAPDATFDPDAPWMSSEEASNLIASCVEESGWPVTASEPGAFEVVVPPEQKTVYESDLKQCYVDHRVGIDPAPPLTKELAETEYDAQVKAGLCLTELGIEVPDLPTYQVFEDALLTENRIIGIYGLADEAGLDLATDSAAWQQCPDPLDSWGHNG